MRRSLPFFLVIALFWVLPALAGRAADDGFQPPIPLGRNLRFFVRPTLMGLVPPVDSEGYGEAFIRVLRVDSAGLDVRYEIKERIAQDAKADDAPRIRRGEIHVTGFEDGTGITPPLFWPDGDWTAADGLIWLPRAGYQELIETGSCPWQIDYSAGAEDEAVAELRRHLNSQSTAEGVTSGEFHLTLESQDHYPCWVNGERTELPAQRAVDSLGLAEYWILANEANPLLLKMSFIPPAAEAAASDHAADELGLLEAGIGYAIVEIDY